MTNNSEVAAFYNIQLGMAYLRQEEMPRAKEKFLKALKLAPSFSVAHSAMAYYFEKAGDSPKAQVYYLKALALAPRSGAELNNYGAFLCRRGKYLQAENYFIKAANEVSYLQTAAALENAGLCSLSIPDEKKAKNYFTKALQQDPQRKQSLYELVQLELKNHRPREAWSLLIKHKKMSFSDPNLIKLVKRSINLAKHQGVELNRPLSKLASVREVRGDTEHRTGVYKQVYEDSSTVSQTQFSSDVAFRKRSNNSNRLAELNPHRDYRSII